MEISNFLKIYNLIHSAIKISTLVSLALLPMMTACSANDEPAVPDGDTFASGIRFGIEEIASRELNYDGLGTTFSDGDSIGCVIGTKNTDNGSDYLAYSMWKYCAATGMLVLKKVEYKCVAPKHDTWEKDNHVYDLYPWNYNLTANKVIQQDLVPGEKEENDGFVKLMKNGVNYTFHWIYPFVKEDTLGHHPGNHPVLSTTDEWGGPHTSFMATYLGKIHDQYDRKHVTDSEWKEALCFVNPDQSTLAKLCRSDYMTARTTVLTTGSEINTGTAPSARTQPVKFVKLNAAIEVEIEGEGNLSNITFTSGTGRLTMGSGLDVEQNRRINLTKQINGVNFNNWTHPANLTLTPCPLQPGKSYRLVITPQVTENLTINFSIDGTTYSGRLSKDQLVLEANHLYKIRLRKAQNHTYVQLLVIRDWVDTGLHELDGWAGAYEIMPI